LRWNKEITRSTLVRKQRSSSKVGHVVDCATGVLAEHDVSNAQALRGLEVCSARVPTVEHGLDWGPSIESSLTLEHSDR